jgi:hypothetical protein
MQPSHFNLLTIAFWSALAGLAPAGWAGLHLIGRRAKRVTTVRVLFATRVLAGFACFWLLIHGLGRLLMVSGGWTGGLVALSAAAATETVIWLSAAERKTLSPRIGRWLLGLRLSLVLLLLCVLLQPVISYETQTRHERFIAVLVDDSASMQLTDPQSTPAEKLGLARLYGLAQVGPPSKLEQSLVQLAALRQELESQLGAVKAIPPGDAETVAAQIRRRREPLAALLGKLKDFADANRRELLAVLPARPKADAKLRQAVQAAFGGLDKLPAGGLDPLRKLLESEPSAALAGALEPIRSEAGKLVDQLNAIEIQGEPLPAALDEALYLSLPLVKRDEVDRLLQETRQAVARQVLLGSGSQPEGPAKAPAGRACLLDALAREHALRLVLVAAKPRPADPRQWRSTAPADDEADTGDTLSTADWRKATDLGAALGQVQREIPADQLAGVLVVSDGRHNHGSPVEPVAREMGLHGVPVASVVIGSAAPRRDAALADVRCPQTVFLGDKVHLNAAVKAIGCRGQQVVVKLVYKENTVDEQTIQVADDDFRTTVPLTHEPKEVGIHAYTVQLQPPVGVVFPGNKKVDCQVAVTDGRIKLLLVDDRPRWEFRYLRNLFAGRDKTVQLQWVLLHPDQLAGGGKPARSPASAARPYGEFEATMPPETAEDWLKFEVVVLGDLPPETLDEATLGVLKKFVGQQGGTLVVVAGPNFMPHAFADSPLAELLPANFEKDPRPQFESPEPAYRLRLTREGTTHPIMSQRTNPTENLAIWNSLPPLDWRHRVAEVKPGATVLAYAEPVDLEELDSAAPVGVQPAAATAAEIDPEKLRLQTKNPLILLQQYGAGNVLLLNFDRTWRLRYRVGDPYHHRFWTQVLRWATAAKLSAGTAHIRLGTQRLRYQGDEPVVVRAQLLDEENNPVSGGDVQARVYQDDQLLMKKYLTSIPDSRGLYEGDLGPMHAAGTYRVELGGSSVDTLRGLDNTESVKTDFLVTPVERTSELVELSADWKIPRVMAELSGGRAVGPADARSLLDLFQAGSRDVREEKFIPLWDSWPLLTLILAAACGEWGLRKKAGLV